MKLAPGKSLSSERLVVPMEEYVEGSRSPDGMKIRYVEKRSRLIVVGITSEPTVSVSPPREPVKIDTMDIRGGR
jgi:hypothetical protein